MSFAPSASLWSLYACETNGRHAPRQVIYGPFLSLAFVDITLIPFACIPQPRLRSRQLHFHFSHQCNPKTGNFHIYPNPPPPLHVLIRDADDHTVKLTHACDERLTIHTQHQNSTDTLFQTLQSTSLLLGVLTGSTARLMAHLQK
jgi:hypothetical protein